MFEAVLNWVKHNRKEREPYLPDMLEFVRMPLLTPRYITDVIDAEVSRATRQRLVVVRNHPTSLDYLMKCLITVTTIIMQVLTCCSPSFGVACHVETSSTKPRNST